jgi:hypothetical protein
MGLLEPNVVLVSIGAPGVAPDLQRRARFGSLDNGGLSRRANSSSASPEARRKVIAGNPARPLANGLTLLRLCYWIGVDIYNRSNPINALLAINASLCLLPLAWLVAAIRANRSLNRELVSP